MVVKATQPVPTPLMSVLRVCEPCSDRSPLSFTVHSLIPQKVPSASLAGSGGTEAAWQHGSSLAEEELMEKLRAESSVEGGQEVKNWKVSSLLKAAHSLGYVG